MRRSFVAVVVSWLVVVAIGSTLVWAVISQVGDGLGTTSGSPLAQSSTPSSSVSLAGPSPSRSHRTPSSASSSPSSPPSSSSSSSSPPSSGASASGTSPSGPSSSGPPSPPASTQGPEPRRATWQGLGGTVVAECTGPAVRQASVQPDPGFRVEVGNPGPEELEVEFEGREDEEGSHTHVRAVCVGGIPKFSVQTED